MSEVAAARPKTSGKKSTPSELEDWARKKSPVGSPKAAPRSPPAAAAAAEAPGGAALPAMKQGLPEESPKAMARMMASGRGATGGFYTGVSCESGQHTGVFHKPCSTRDPDMPLRTPAAASRFMPRYGGDLLTGEGNVVPNLKT